MTQSDNALFLALGERVRVLEERLDVLSVKLQQRLFGDDVPMEEQPDHAALRAAKAEQYPRGATGRRIAS